jgi:RNA polymerase sigma-70 factor (ECF subfamily)
LQPNDQEYWQLISQGDKIAFEKAFRAFYAALCNYALSLVKDKDESEEVVQNVFFNIWNKRTALQVSGSLKSYLYRSVHNECLNKIKHVKMKTTYAEDYRKNASGSFDNAADHLHAKELGQKINTAIDSLPEQCGNVFKLSRFENLKYNEIAQHLNISIKTVENHMGKALKILREQLKDYLPLIFWIWSIIA